MISWRGQEPNRTSTSMVQFYSESMSSCIWYVRYIGCVLGYSERETLLTSYGSIQYIPRNMHTVFALLCFVVVIHWLIFPYPSGLLHWHCGNLPIAPVPAKQPWWIWINTSCEFIMNDCITTTKQSTTKPCAYFLGYTVRVCVCYLTHTMSRYGATSVGVCNWGKNKVMHCKYNSNFATKSVRPMIKTCIFLLGYSLFN